MLAGSVLTFPVLASGKLELTDREKAEHVLNRLAFGPAPGQIEEVLETGIDSWIEAQLQPSTIDDPSLERILGELPTLAMPSDVIFERYLRPALERGRSDDRGTELDRQSRRSNARIPILELSVARVARAIESERQLDEVMVWFWLNHFNVYAGKPPASAYLSEFENDVIRPAMWGSFEDLLIATAKSPAMLMYLDNARSVAEKENRPASRRAFTGMGPGGRSGIAGRGMRGGATRPRGLGPERARRIEQAGLNENYARELMELHTLGVDGGYGQEDVIALARLLTGWSVRRPSEGSGFVFRRELHDVEGKVLLGREFERGGSLEEGEEALRMLARHPSTARHIAWKLATYLVADRPPAPLVDRVAARYVETGGDLRETVRAVVTDEAFFDPAFYRAKTRTPFELVVSAVRASGHSIEPRLLVLQLRNLGQPPYGCEPPTGYSDLAEDWTSTNQLVSRLNFATALASHLPARDPGSVEEEAARWLAVPLTEATAETIRQRVDASEGPPLEKWRLMVALIVGSPDFQKQ